MPLSAFRRGGALYRASCKVFGRAGGGISDRMSGAVACGPGLTCSVGASCHLWCAAAAKCTRRCPTGAASVLRWVGMDSKVEKCASFSHSLLFTTSMPKRSSAWVGALYCSNTGSYTNHECCPLSVWQVSVHLAHTAPVCNALLSCHWGPVLPFWSRLASSSPESGHSSGDMRVCTLAN